ncbi:MAG TPA: hypothetical protein VE074_15945 [Jatrophihabitantaceae bacterium]|nr:hypothetical protein [Jatrophihabitantaceae bacterium]
MRLALASVLLLILVACGSGRPSSTASGKTPCGELYARLQQVTAALNASSELIANSLGTQQLSEGIAVEEDQLRQSARLMASAPVPAELAATNDRIVTALRAMTADFARAKAPAARGDFQAAAEAMTDRAAVARIVDASSAIEAACA